MFIILISVIYIPIIIFSPSTQKEIKNKEKKIILVTDNTKCVYTLLDKSPRVRFQLSSAINILVSLNLLTRV